MSNDTQTVVNNYTIDATSLVQMIARQEQDKLVNLFKQTGMIVEKDGELLGIAYDNWDERDNEGHEPVISLKRISSNGK